MQDASVVEMGQADGDLAKKFQGICRVKRTIFGQEIIEGAVFDVVHDVVRGCGIPAHVQKLYDVPIC